MIRFVLMAASAAGVVWLSARATPEDVGSAAERAVQWVNELPARAHFRSPLERRPEAEPAQPSSDLADEAPSAEPVTEASAAAPESVEERFVVSRTPLAETPQAIEPLPRVELPGGRGNLSPEEAERVRCRLDRVMTLARGNTP